MRLILAIYRNTIARARLAYLMWRARVARTEEGHLYTRWRPRRSAAAKPVTPCYRFVRSRRVTTQNEPAGG